MNRTVFVGQFLDQILATAFLKFSFEIQNLIFYLSFSYIK